MATNLIGQQPPTDSRCILFTDIEGSTKLVDSYGNYYPQILTRHCAVIREAVEARSGTVERVVGDSFLAHFPDSTHGVQAAIDAQIALDHERWPHGEKIRVRMGLHKGTIQYHGDGLVGIEVHRAARIGAVAHGGQVVISNTVCRDISGRPFKPDIKIRDLGFHRLKDLRYPESLYDLVIPGLPSDFAPVSSIGANRTNLSFHFAPFFGRQHEMEDVKDLLLRKQSRLVTLTGTGGAGKTSLALAIGRDLVESFSRGVFLVQFGDVNSVDLIASAICQALHIQETAGVDALNAIQNSIGDAEILLILDTFEHLVDGADQIVTLLSECPNLFCLVTSRKSLDVSPESEVSVVPLPVPEEGSDFSEVAGNAAVQLFVQLAQQERNGDFVLSTGNCDSVAAICRRLDGLPLAIKLAASHTGLLEPIDLEARLRSAVDLKSKSRAAVARHQTLRATIEWSDKLLSERERRTFLDLSVFSGGFGVDAAEFVLRGDSEQADFLSDIESLVAQSLLYRTTALGRARLDMLDTIREYANQGLGKSERAARCSDRHAQYFVSLAEDAAPNVMLANQRNYVEVLFQETGNIRTAIGWLLRQPTPSQAIELLEALKWFWITRGLYSEARRWIDAAVERVHQVDDERSVAAALDMTGWIRYMSGDVRGAQQACDKSYQIYKRLDDRAGIASSGIIAGITHAIGGDLEHGGKLIVDSLHLFRALGDDHGTVVALLAIGEGSRDDGDEVTAEEHQSEALRLLREMGNTFWQGHVLQNFAHYRLHQGDWKQAREFASEALAISEEYDYPMVVNLAVAAISGVALASGAASESARLIGAVDARLQRIGAGFEHTDASDFGKIKNQAKKTLGAAKYGKLTAEGAVADWDSVVAAARRY